MAFCNRYGLDLIIFIYGTTAEAIKIAPISRRLTDLEHPQLHWITYQHTEALREIESDLGLPGPDLIIANGADGKPLKTRKDAIVWLWSISKWTAKNLIKVKRNLPQDTVVIVHGDTMTSVVGAVLGRLLNVPVAHIEAGLRSGNWRHPFPEELDRRIVGKLAKIHYAPSKEAVENLSHYKNVVFTEGNTVNDAVLDFQRLEGISEHNYGLVLLHRFELISNPELLASTISTLVEYSPFPLKFIVDAYSRGPVGAELEKLEKSKHQLIGKTNHQAFISLLVGAKFIVTDSGGIQEETALLGVPTLIHRVATERNEGLGQNAVLSMWDQRNIQHFLKDYQIYRQNKQINVSSPSDIIISDLLDRGY